jgi:ribosome-associated protein
VNEPLRDHHTEVNNRRRVREDGDVEAPRDVEIREDSIRLGQLLKLADLVDAGADVKPLMVQGAVSVNGETETRRGRQLVKGDVVTVRGESVRVS